MSKSSSDPSPSATADAIRTLTSQVNRIHLSQVNHDQDGNGDFHRSSSNTLSRSQIPTSLQPANGAQTFRPTPAHSSQRMEMPVPMIAIHMPPVYTGESLTMSYARSIPPQPPYASVPQFPQPLTPPQSTSRTHSSSSSIPSSPKVNIPPVAHTRPRASSTPATPISPVALSSSSTVQCAGTTKAGKRCTRQVKAPPLVSYFTSSDIEPIERLCFQHTKEVLQPTGFYSRKQGAGWVEYSGSCKF